MGITNRESDVLSACLRYLSMRGVFSWRSNNTGVYDPHRKRFRSFRGMKGVSDILGIVPQQVEADGEELIQGVFLAIEVKRPGGKTSDTQEWFLEQVRELGGIALRVSSVRELEAKLEPFLQFVPEVG